MTERDEEKAGRLLDDIGEIVDGSEVLAKGDADDEKQNDQADLDEDCRTNPAGQASNGARPGG